MKSISERKESIPIQDIIIKNRIRKDLGDIDSLKKSIAKVGLLHPVIVDKNLHLISGERRLRAVKKLGWNNISVRVLPTSDEYEKLNVEIEENFHRQDFNYAEIKKAIAQKEKLKAKKELPWIIYIFFRIKQWLKKLIN